MKTDKGKMHLGFIYFVLFYFILMFWLYFDWQQMVTDKLVLVFFPSLRKEWGIKNKEHMKGGGGDEDNVCQHKC